MNRAPYNYMLLRYTHSQATGEGLNVGLLMVAPLQRWVRLLVESRYLRLSKAFPGFDGQTYRTMVARLQARADKLAERMRSDELGLDGMSLRAVCVHLLPDTGLSFSFGDERTGFCTDLEAEGKRLYAEFIEAYQDVAQRDRRSDDDLWHDCVKALDKHGIPRVLQSKRIVTDLAEHEFHHAYRNQRWHVIEPVSFDYVREDELGRKAQTLTGLGLALKDSDELGKIHLVLGRPTAGRHMKAYGKAKDLLNQMPTPHQIIEEDEIEDFSTSLVAEMRDHGVFEQV